MLYFGGDLGLDLRSQAKGVEAALVQGREEPEPIGGPGVRLTLPPRYSGVSIAAHPVASSSQACNALVGVGELEAGDDFMAEDAETLGQLISSSVLDAVG